MSTGKLTVAPGDTCMLSQYKEQERVRGNPGKWLKRPDLKAEVRRSLKRAPADALLKADRPCPDGGHLTPSKAKTIDEEIRDSRAVWGKIPKPVSFMTPRELKAELGRQAKRLGGGR
jgi:hypothetical protein